MRTVREAFAGFRRTPLLCGLSIGAIGLSLVILGLFGLVAYNVRGVIGDVERRVEVVGYLLDDAGPEQVLAARRELEALPAVEAVRYVSKDEALERARRDLVEFSGIYGELRVNPLPASFHLQLREDFRTSEAVSETASLLASYPFIEEARFGDEWVERLFALRSAAVGIAVGLGGGFALVAVLLIVTTVRMAIFARSEEIEIMQIVGAREGYIQRPFLLEGAITGLAGGLLALGVTRLAYFVFPGRFAAIELAWLPHSWTGAGVAGAAALGILAAAFSVHREMGRVHARPGGPWMRRLLTAVTVVVGTSPAWAAPAPANAQESPDVRRRLDESEGRLALIREERQRLRLELEGIAGQVSGDSAELVNIERQIAASASLLGEFDVQRLALSERLTAMTREMLLTRDELTARQVVLRERLREIYKRGPLRTVEMLLSSRSFSDLLNRYRYLHDVALFDRILLEDVRALERRLTDQRTGLSRESDRMARVREAHLREYDELGRLEQEREARLRRFSDRRTEAQSSLGRLATEEAQLRGLIAALENRRRSAEREAGVASVPALTTGDLGRLAWPVEGDVLWHFGPERDGRTTIPREGIGIAAPRGTPVNAVERGTVASVAVRASGQTVIVDHGGGFYSSYRKLRDVTVREGQSVAEGQAIGYVGGDATRPHIEFQIYEPGAAGPRAVDPVRWLRGRG